MPEIRKKKVIFIAVVAGVLAALLMAIFAYKVLRMDAQPAQVNPPPVETRPPVIVVGGSLEGHSSGSWLESYTCNGGTTVPEEYCADVSNGGNSYILSSSNYNPLLRQTISNTWTIHFTDLKPDGTENHNQGILLCNYSPCGCAYSPCDLNPPLPPPSPDSNHVYIRLFDRKHSVWDSKSDHNGGKLYAHDKSDKDCDDPNGKGGKCDYPYNAVLFTAGGAANGNAYRCNGSSSSPCEVGVGNPPLTEQSSGR